MVVGLAILFVAFEWSNRDVKVAQDQGVADVIAEEQIEITALRKHSPPPPLLLRLNRSIERCGRYVDLEQQDIVTSEDTRKQLRLKPMLHLKWLKKKKNITANLYMVETMPQFPGGDAALLQFLAKSIKYPVIAQENGIKVVYLRIRC